MEDRNKLAISGFVLLGLTEKSRTAAAYIQSDPVHVSVHHRRNLLIILAIISDSQFHTPISSL
jgi:hypothetical protein